MQGATAPSDPAKAMAALRRLRPPGRELVLRLNRMFWSDGRAGLDRFAALVDGYARAGFRSELQVRYHPPDGHAGDMAGWLAYVRAAVRTFAPRRSVVGLSITNEANLPGSPNTSDGFYSGVIDALVQGVIAARAEADRLGRPDLRIGFSYAYRSAPQSDDRFFEQLREKGGAAFARAVDEVGLQVYPGVFWPPVTTDPAGDVIEALTLLRGCWMPKAGLGPGVALSVTENGYATRGGVGADRQAADLRATVDAVERWSGTLGVTDYRYFNLRDNASRGPDLFDAVGLLFDDYREKPAFAVYRDAIARTGAARPAPLTVRPSRRRPCTLFPRSFSTNRPVAKLPVLPNSDAIIRSIGLAQGLHADFGSGRYEGSRIGIPYDVVTRRTPRSKVRFDYAGESDRVRYPIPRGVHIEGGGDRHALLWDKGRCRLYELFDLEGRPGSWTAGSGATWNLRKTRLRPAGWTSADAAGLPILPLLARYPEVKRGAIRHALRVTVSRSRRAYVYPARHFASDLTDPDLPRMGERLRLKSSIDISHLPRQARIVAKALKRYGLIVADNGSDWFVSGAPDRRWDNDQLHSLDGITGRDFEVVDARSLRPR